MTDRATSALVMTARLAGLLALASGAAYWLGVGGLPLHLHLALGVLLVLVVWILAARGIGRATGLAIAAAIVAALVPVLGILQLAGPLFDNLTLTRLLHVAVALATLGLAEVVAKRTRRV